MSAKQNLAAVANLTSNTLSQTGRCFIVHCTFKYQYVKLLQLVFALLHYFWSFFMLYCKISTNNIINNTKGSHENRPMTVLEMWSNKTMSISKHIFEIYIDWLIDPKFLIFVIFATSTISSPKIWHVNRDWFCDKTAKITTQLILMAVVVVDWWCYHHHTRS